MYSTLTTRRPFVDYFGVPLTINLAEAAKMADELGRLEAALRPLRATIARVDALRKAFRFMFRDTDPTTAHRVAGDAYEVVIGACGHESQVNTPALVERIGNEKFASIATASLKAIELHCGADVLAAVVLAQQTGPRSLTVNELPAAVAVAVAVAKPKRKRAA